jgi:acetyl-CoA carboxylase carboxyl transferase subunit alpha
MVIGTQKGRDTKENILRNFGSAHPEGYRKALRLMRLADKFGLPIITLIDTAGAYPGVAAEERHIAEAIAVNLREMMLFEVPIISAVIGEGGSGGALGIGVADRVLILENAYYSVISPEGCAAILWKDRANAGKAAAALKITAKDLLELKLVDEIVPEPLGGAHTDSDGTAANLKTHLSSNTSKKSRAAGGGTVEIAVRKIPRARTFPGSRRGRRMNPANGCPKPPDNEHALSTGFSTGLQGTCLGRTRARTALWQGSSRPARSSANHGRFPTGRAMPASSPTARLPEKTCAG